MKEYDRALLIAEQGLEIFPHYPDLLYVTSVIYQNLDMADKSIQLLEKALNIYPFNLEIRSLLGRTLMFQGYYHSALSVMSHFTIISHELAGVNKLFIAYCKAYSGNAQSVIESLDWCEEDFSHVDDNAWYLAVIRALKVIALIQNQEVDAALRLVSEIEAEFDDTLFVAYAKGIAAWKNSDLISAETFLRLACSSNPCDMRAKKDLAALLSVLGRHEEAADIQREMKGFFGPWNRNENPLYRAEELIRSENFDEAERYLSWACENYPDRHDLILSMISLCSFTGHYDLVISYADSLKNSEFEWKSLYL
ncbi:hypothetical protein, partial [Methanospirillum hungatei]|uniref:tetratricopeptide repeat protein n=1 Tax=Methanospirillum hungatei TaxID=2203 RepID=UPI0026EAB21D